MQAASSKTAAAGTCPFSDEWCADHFDHVSPDLAQNLHETLACRAEGVRTVIV
jgi:hypothetical protein